MVRIKYRYLLINILYPNGTTTTSTSSSTTTTTSSKPSTPLPPTVQFHSPTSDALTSQLLLRIIRETVTDLFGDYGSGMIASSLMIKYLSPATSTAIIRVSRAHYRLVWAALTYITRLPRQVGTEQSCVVQVVRVSGTIRKSEEEAIRRARASIVKARRAGGEGPVLMGDKFVDGGGRDEDVDRGIEDMDEDGDEDDDED